MSSSETEVCIMPLPITGLLGCCIQVVPGTSQTDAPADERTELCAVDANWIVGNAPTCDVHMHVLCDITDWSWDELLAEAGRDQESANRSWEERERHSQGDTQAQLVRFRGDGL